jgi:hypothetical protein
MISNLLVLLIGRNDAAAPGPYMNVALPVNGTTASATSEAIAASNAINGSWLPSGSQFWQSTGGEPQTFELNFGQSRTFDFIRLIHLEDNYTNSTVLPTLSDTGSLYINAAYTIDYWNGSSWINIPEATETSNSNVLKQYFFSPVTGTKVRIVITDNTHSSLVFINEFEVWGN